MKHIPLAIKLIIFFIIISSPLLMIMVWDGITFNYAEKLSVEIKNSPDVLDVKFFIDEGKILTVHNTYGFRLNFIDGGRIILRHVNPWGKSWGDRAMRIESVNGYSTFSFHDKNGKPYVSVLEIWSEIIGVQLETIMDVVENYHLISKHVNSWTNRDDYRINDDERFIDVLNRIIEEKPDIETVMYKGNEILLTKNSISTR